MFSGRFHSRNNVQDKIVEKDRYDKKALNSRFVQSSLNTGTLSLPFYLRTPYLFFDKLLHDTSKKDFLVLEIASGTGSYTLTPLKNKAKVTATDISQASLEVLGNKFSNFTNLKCMVADMELLPFDEASFDLVYSAGGLSYGDNATVAKEIYRVLKPGGFFICVDSLNHNPIYIFNRYIHFLLNHRTKSTLRRMPTLKTIEYYKNIFGKSDVYFFGSIVWCAPLLQFFLKPKLIKSFIDWFDSFVNARKSAFKFVMIVSKI